MPAIPFPDTHKNTRRSSFQRRIESLLRSPDALCQETSSSIHSFLWHWSTWHGTTGKYSFREKRKKVTLMRVGRFKRRHAIPAI